MRDKLHVSKTPELTAFRTAPERRPYQKGQRDNRCTVTSHLPLAICLGERDRRKGKNFTEALPSEVRKGESERKSYCEFLLLRYPGGAASRLNPSGIAEIDSLLGARTADRWSQRLQRLGKLR